jgi:serine protease
VSHVSPFHQPLRTLAALAAALIAVLLGLSASGALSTWLKSGSGEAPAAAAAAALPYTPHQLVVGAPDLAAAALAAEIRARTGIAVTATAVSSAGVAGEWLVELPQAVGVPQVAARIRTLPGVGYAVPNYIAHVAGGSNAPTSWFPNDVGRGNRREGWRGVQWNFVGYAGVGAPQAWANLRRDHHPGAKGVVIAVVDTGVAFENWGQFTRSPDFKGTKFVDPCDLVASHLTLNGACTNPHPLDREGHGTFVAGVIAEATNNRIGLTGLAYRAAIMPIRVLNADGDGQAATIGAGIRYAVRNHAKVINLSLEFTIGTTAEEIPEVTSAIAYAHRHGAIVVAAAGNDSAGQGIGRPQLAYPARDPNTISVGATTKDACLAEYSNVGPGLDIVAPGGGDDTASADGGAANCNPDRNLPDVYQMTFANPKKPDLFGLPGGWYGTSMATPEVSAGAAMVVASRLLGRYPSSTSVLRQLEYSARVLSGPAPNEAYGYGLLDLGDATAQVYTAPGSPLTTTPIATTATGS